MIYSSSVHLTFVQSSTANIDGLLGAAAEHTFSMRSLH